MFYKHLIHLRLKYNMKKFTYCVLFYVYNLNKLKKLFLYLNMNKIDYTYVSNIKYLSRFVFFQKLLIGSYLFVYTNNLEFLQKIEFEHFLQKIQISGIL